MSKVMEHYVCELCGFTSPQPLARDLWPVHHVCDPALEQPGPQPRPVALQHRDPELIVQRFCQACDAFDGMRCKLDYGCPKCATPQAWRREIAAGRECPTGRFQRVSLCILSPGLHLGGAEQWLVELSEQLPRESFEIRAVWITAARGIGVHEPFVERLAAVGVPVMCKEDGLAPECDLVISWGIPHPRQWVHGDPIVISVAHGCGEQALAFAYNGSDADRSVAVSQAAAATLRDRPTNAVIYNGANRRRLEPTRPPAETRAAWGLTDEHQVALYLGRIAPGKGLPRLAAAGLQLGGNWRLVFMGPQRNAEVVQTCRNINPQIIWRKPEDQVGDALAAADVFVLPSQGEAMSVSLCEAWLAGVPTVTTPVGAVPELTARFGPVATLVDVYPTPLDLARAIRRTDEAARQRAHQVASRYLTTEAMVRRWSSYLLAAARTRRGERS